MRTQRLKERLRKEEVIEGSLIEVVYKEDEAMPILTHAASSVDSREFSYMCFAALVVPGFVWMDPISLTSHLLSKSASELHCETSLRR